MPTPRLQREHAALVVAAAAEATRNLGGFYPWPND
jgi:hypothetical protein